MKEKGLGKMKLEQSNISSCDSSANRTGFQSYNLSVKSSLLTMAKKTDSENICLETGVPKLLAV